MPTRVFIMGEVYDENNAVVSVFDRGFLYGDSVYEVTRTAKGIPVDLDRHLDRLAESAAAILLAPPGKSELLAAVERTLLAAQNPESYVRIMVTRGAGPLGLDPALADTPRTIVIVRPLSLPAPELYREGASLAVVDVRWNLRRAVDPAVKSGNYLTNVMALAKAREAGAYEAAMCNADGTLAEGSSSNLFCVRDGVVCTPPIGQGLLAGITRRRVLELARAAGCTVSEAPLDPDALGTADEVFLTSSIRGVLPVTRVDGSAVGDGKVGVTTRMLMDFYEQFLSRVGAGKV